MQDQTNPMPVSIAVRWEQPPAFVLIPDDATREPELRLRFAVPPPPGTPERRDWDELRLGGGR